MTDYSQYIISDTTRTGTDYSKYIVDEDKEKESFFARFPNLPDLIRNKLWEAKRAIGLPDLPDVRLKTGLPFGIPRPKPEPIPEFRGIQPAEALTTRVAAPTPPRDTAIRAPDIGEWEQGPFKPAEMRAAEPDVQKAVGTGLWKAINKVVRPGKDPVGNTIKGGIRFAMGIANFPSELTQMASDILVHSKGPIEALEMTGEKIDEMAKGLAKPLENLLWLVGHQASPVEAEKMPEEYRRRLDELAGDPSAPLVSLIIGKGIAHGVKRVATRGRLAKKMTEITDYVKARRAGLPPADVAKVTFPEPTPTVEGPMPKKIVVGKEELATKKALKARGVTEFTPEQQGALGILNAAEKQFPETMRGLERAIRQKDLPKIKSYVDDVRASAFKAPEALSEQLYAIEEAIYKFIPRETLRRIPRKEELALKKKLRAEGVTEKPALKAAKEPWEMTREEFLEEYGVTQKERADIRAGKLDDLGNRARNALREHEDQIRRGIRTKKPVPAEVLAEYPELAKKGPGEPTMLYSGIPVPEMVKEISRLTNDLVQKAKGPPEVRVGVKQAKQAMIEHDRQVRDGEWVHRVMKKGFGDAIPDPNRQLAIIHAVQQKRNPKYFNQLTPQEKGIAKWMELELDKLEAFNREHQITDIAKLPEGVRYVPGSWKNPKTGEPYPMMYGKFSKGLPQAKQKKFATYEEGMAAGAKMATTNLGDIIGGAWESLTRAHQSRAMFKTLHQVGAEKDMTIQLMPGKTPKPMRMVERWDLLNKQGLTDGYTRFSHPSLDKAITFRDASGALVKLKGAVGVRNELFPFVKAYLENPSYGAFSRLNFATKSLKLGLSAFHVMSLGMQEAANWRVPFVNIPRGLKAIKNLNPELRILHREGLDLFKGYEDIGYRNRFFEGSNDWGKMGNIITKPIEGMRSFIFDVVQPGMKASFALDKYQKLLPKYLKKGLTKEQCARECVRAADGHFSHEHWKRSLLETNRFMVKLYFMPEARRAWQTALLSPTWQREHMLVAKDVVKSFMPDKWIKELGMREMGPIKSEYRKYALGGTMLIAMADLYNLMATEEMDGKARHIWQNPSVFSVRALWDRPAYTVETKDGKTRTIKGGPAYFRPFKSIYEVAEWVSDPPQKFIYKVSPFMAGIGHQMWPSKYQKDYKGWEDIPERAWDLVTDVATPISWAHVAGYLQGKKEWPDVALPFFGMPTSKLSGTAFKDFYYGQLADIEKKHGRNNEWYRLRRSFDFNPTTYKKYRENP